MKGEMEDVDLSLYDVVKCFDKLWLQDTLNDLFEAGVKDDKLVLLYKENQRNSLAVKTPFGLTERKSINNIVTQGGVWGPIQCSVEIDEIGKECMDSGERLYKYKNCVYICPLAMIHDLAGISICGPDSIEFNLYK